MSYAHIDNLYRAKEILLFRECYAMEKIHGSSSHISFKDSQLHFFAGGETHEAFLRIFNVEELAKKFNEIYALQNITVYGEVYGGRCQAMSHTYGDKLKFIVFDISYENIWQDVPVAERMAINLGLEFVHYKKISTDIKEIDAERDAESVQAIRNGCGPGKKREGVVLRPLIEMANKTGERIVAKHKRADFSENKTQREVDVSSDKLQILEEANAIAEEWVTANRLKNILSHLPEDKKDISNMKNIIQLMVDDVIREGRDEIVDSKDSRKAISTKTVQLFKNMFCKI